MTILSLKPSSSAWLIQVAEILVFFGVSLVEFVIRPEPGLVQQPEELRTDENLHILMNPLKGLYFHFLRGQGFQQGGVQDFFGEVTPPYPAWDFLSVPGKTATSSRWDRRSISCAILRIKTI